MMRIGTATLFLISIIQVVPIIAHRITYPNELIDSCDGFECENGLCLDYDNQCDKVLDCPSGEDEEFCSYDDSKELSTESTLEMIFTPTLLNSTSTALSDTLFKVPVIITVIIVICVISLVLVMSSLCVLNQINLLSNGL
ncbi:hypothetical protein ACKWTF_016241 [Chironomus riparius]